MKLEGRTIVVSGASRGLGRALARRFAAEGASLALCARTAAPLEAVAAECAASGVRVFARAIDIAHSESVADFARDALAELKRVDGVVNNASMLGERVRVDQYPLAVWDDVVQTNVNGTFFLTRAFLGPMMQRGSGFVINVSSSVGKAGRKEWGAYAVSKFAVEGFTQVLAEELRPFNIRVNAVNPGPMATDMRRQAYPNEDPAMLRTPDQLTDVFVYLASADGVGITGQSLDASTFISQPGMLS